MPLVVAIKNFNTIVVASDTDMKSNEPGAFGQLMPLPNHTVLLMAGNLEAVRPTITETVLPRITPGLSAAAAAQVLHAALVMEMVPKLDHLKGRLELIVAGIDPIRHIEQPGLYYFDSAQEFNLQLVQGDAIAAGATAAAYDLLAGHDFSAVSVDQLKALAKDCLASTKMRWPAALRNHVELAVVTARTTQMEIH